MKPFEGGKLIGEALAELHDVPVSEEELRTQANLIAGWLAESQEDAEQQQAIIRAGILYGATQEK